MRVDVTKLSYREIEKVAGLLPLHAAALHECRGRIMMDLCPTG